MNDENKNAVIGARIMQRRKLLGMKQSELAELIGVSDNQISNIENGRSYPKLNSFMLICKALDCNAAQSGSRKSAEAHRQDAHKLSCERERKSRVCLLKRYCFC